MPLAVKLDSLENVSDELHAYYKEQDGVFVLDTDGLPPSAQSKVAEFRDNNIKLSKKTEELENRLKMYDGIDVEQARQAMDKVRSLEEKELLEKGDVDTLVNQRVEEERRNYAKQLESMRKSKEEADNAAKSAKQKLNDYLIENRILQAVNETSVPHQAAIPDILFRAKAQWKMDENDSIYAVDSSGAKMYDATGDNLLTPQQWAKDLMKTASHLFQESTGSNAKGSTRTSKNQPNPFKSGSTSLSEQTRLYRDDPSRARALASEAGMNL